jgi:two-component system KDP operon response regulator KdpE
MNNSAGRILIVDDDPKLRRALHSTLHSQGFDIAECPSGEQALREAKIQKFDVVLLDINMPGMGGIAACRELRRAFPNLQILMLTVRDSEQDKIQALEAGADDYVTKPFSIRELTARIRASMRRATSVVLKMPEILTIGDIELDSMRRTVKKRGETVHLTPKEFELLNYLMAHAGAPVTHEALLHAVWGDQYGQEREYLRTFIHELRKKIEDDPGSPRYLLTEAYVGYRFAEPEPSDNKD